MKLNFENLNSSYLYGIVKTLKSFCYLIIAPKYFTIYKKKDFYLFIYACIYF